MLKGKDGISGKDINFQIAIVALFGCYWSTLSLAALYNTEDLYHASDNESHYIGIRADLMQLLRGSLRWKQITRSYGLNSVYSTNPVSWQINVYTPGKYTACRILNWAC